MDRLQNLKKQLEQLKSQKLVAESLIKKTDENIQLKEEEMGKCYQTFFDKKTSKSFVDYDRFPGLEALQLYVYKLGDGHPLKKYGIFNLKELAEIIKLFYQFQRQEEYQILTFGVNYEQGTPVYGGQTFDLIPHLFIAVGNNKTLQPYKAFDGSFIDSSHTFDFEYRSPKKDLIVIQAEHYSFFNKDKHLDLECTTNNLFDTKGKINYYDYLKRSYTTTEFSAEKNIYYWQLRQHFYKYKGVKDVLSFDSHLNDSFIAKLLINISIYKKNNNILELTDKDYEYIFDILFGQKVNVIEQAEKDIPKVLKYVPHTETIK